MRCDKVILLYKAVLPWIGPERQAEMAHSQMMQEQQMGQQEMAHKHVVTGQGARSEEATLANVSERVSFSSGERARLKKSTPP